MSSIQKGKFLKHACSLTGKPCIFINIGEFAQCGLCRIAEEKAPLTPAKKSSSVKKLSSLKNK